MTAPEHFGIEQINTRRNSLFGRDSQPPSTNYLTVNSHIPIDIAKTIPIILVQSPIRFVASLEAGTTAAVAEVEGLVLEAEADAVALVPSSASHCLVTIQASMLLIVISSLSVKVARMNSFAKAAYFPPQATSCNEWR